jgi:hypothetical protein
MEKAGKYFGGTMMEARRLLEPDVGDEDEEDEGDESESESADDDA